MCHGPLQVAACGRASVSGSPRSLRLQSALRRDGAYVTTLRMMWVVIFYSVVLIIACTAGWGERNTTFDRYDISLQRRAFAMVAEEAPPLPTHHESA
jgi:hypothetical protein